MLTLQALYDAVLLADTPLLRSSYKTPLKTYIRHYAEMLGCPTPAECPMGIYNLDEPHRRSLFASHRDRFKTTAYLDKVFHGITTLLEVGHRQNLIPAPIGPLKPWPLYRRIPRHVTRTPRLTAQPMALSNGQRRCSRTQRPISATASNPLLAAEAGRSSSAM